MYVIIYGKYVNDKNDGIYMEGVYLYDVTNDESELPKMMQTCIDRHDVDIIIPKWWESEFVCNTISAAKKHFTEIEKSMILSEDEYHHAQQIMTNRRQKKAKAKQARKLARQQESES